MDYSGATTSRGALLVETCHHLYRAARKFSDSHLTLFALLDHFRLSLDPSELLARLLLSRLLCLNAAHVAYAIGLQRIGRLREERAQTLCQGLAHGICLATLTTALH